MRKNGICYILSGVATIAIIYVLFDYFNFLKFLGLDILNINIDLFGIFVNVLLVVALYIISYVYIDKKNTERVRNQEDVSNIVLLSIYEEIERNLRAIDDTKIKTVLLKYIDPNKTLSADNPYKKFENVPFENEDMLMNLVKDGVVEKAVFQEYLDIKNQYNVYMSLIAIFTEEELNQMANICGFKDKLKDVINRLKEELNVRF